MPAKGWRGSEVSIGASGQGSSSVVLRQFDGRAVPMALRRLGTASNAGVARHVDLIQDAAGPIVRGLEAQKPVCGSGKRGQPATRAAILLQRFSFEPDRKPPFGQSEGNTR